MLANRRRQVLRLATSDQACEELPLTVAGTQSHSISGAGQQDAWQRLTELDHRLHQPVTSELIQNNNNKPAQANTLCSICHQLDRHYLVWRLPPESVRLSPQVGPTTSEWAGAVTRAAERGSPVLQSLFDELQNDNGSLTFDQSEPTSRLVADVAGFLSELVSCQLSAELPAVFGDASVTLIGGWAQETALTSEFPVLDFVVNLPGWARASRLCLCQLAPGRANGVVVRHRAAGPAQLVEASAPHRACASAIETAVLQRALGLLEQQRGGAGWRSRLTPSRELGWWRQAGRDWPAEAAQPKRLRLNLAWRGPDDAAARLCGVNVWFGVPVLLMVGGPPEAEQRQLRGHLLLGAGEPRLLRLALEERRWALSRSRGCHDPLPLLCRAAKFVLKLGEYLAEDVSMTGEHRRQPDLSFCVNSALRELALRYGDSGVRQEAFAKGAGLQDRLLDLLRALLGSRLSREEPAVFTESLRLGLSQQQTSSASASSATPLSESTVSIVRYLERANQLPQGTENLLPTMLQYFQLKNQPDRLLRGDEDDRLLGLATQISFDLLTLSD